MKIKLLSFLLVAASLTLTGCQAVNEPTMDADSSNTADEVVAEELVETVSKTPAVPENCKSWFDGCNNCIVGEGGLLGCTRMFCPPEAMEEPKCLEFEE